MTYDELARLALEMPGVAESMSYGQPALKRDRRFMVGLKPDGENVSVKVSWDDHDLFLTQYPELIYKTPHYEGYPAFLVRLGRLDQELATALLKAAWENAPHAAKRIPVR